MVGSTHVSKYLDQLQEMRLVERRLPATVHPSQELRSRQGRYHLRDPFLRFYFRFLAARAADLVYQPERIVPVLQQELKGFVGQTAWEELARAWVSRKVLQHEHGMALDTRVRDGRCDTLCSRGLVSPRPQPRFSTSTMSCWLTWIACTLISARCRRSRWQAQEHTKGRRATWSTWSRKDTRC